MCHLVAAEVTILLREGPSGLTGSVARSGFAEHLANLITITSKPKFWVYNVDESIRWSLAQIVATVGLIYQAVNVTTG